MLRRAWKSPMTPAEGTRQIRFNGAMLRRAWKFFERFLDTCGNTASMGPCSVEHGNHEQDESLGAAIRASMGPCSVEHGNQRPRLPTCLHLPCFNGAMLRRAWKCVRYTPTKSYTFPSFNWAMLRRAWKSRRHARPPAVVAGFNGAMLRRAWKFLHRSTWRRL